MPAAVTMRPRLEAIERLNRIGYTPFSKQREGEVFEGFTLGTSRTPTLIVHFGVGHFVLCLPNRILLREYAKSEHPLFKAVRAALYPKRKKEVIK